MSVARCPWRLVAMLLKWIAGVGIELESQSERINILRGNAIVPSFSVPFASHLLSRQKVCDRDMF